MHRLTGIDAAFVYMETPTMHMHVVGVFVFDSNSAPRFGYEQVRDTIKSRLHLIPPYRQRLVEVPFNLHHPLWIEDPDFDLDYHVRRVAVPQPGGRAQLGHLVADIASRPLDMRRPLWEMYVVEGLEQDRAALVAKVHHAAIDGVSGAELAVSFLDLEPEPPPPPPPAEPWVADRVPADSELLAYAVTSLLRQPRVAVRVVRRTVEALVALWERNGQVRDAQAPTPFRAPRTVFNASITPHRRFAFTEVPLDLVKEVKNAFGVTVNDVVLALCAGALRQYLQDRGEMPDEPLIAMVPVSVRAEEERETSGNRVSAMLVSLATPVRDPAERLRAVAAAARSAKEQEHVIGPELLTDWADLAAPSFAARAARLASSTKIFDRLRPMFNVVISNVPGPSFPLFAAGAKMAAIYPMGPIVEGVGLNITVMSYMGTMFFGILACRELVPEVSDIASHIEASLGELLAVVHRAAGGDPAGRLRVVAGGTEPGPSPPLAAQHPGPIRRPAHLGVPLAATAGARARLSAELEHLLHPHLLHPHLLHPHLLHPHLLHPHLLHPQAMRIPHIPEIAGITRRARYGSKRT